MNKKNLNQIISPKYKIEYSIHSLRRSNQRGISLNHVEIALSYSEAIFKQGLIFYVVKNKLMPNNLNPDIKRNIRNLVIVMASDKAKVLTFYRSSKGLKRIKQKSCRLSINDWKTNNYCA